MQNIKLRNMDDEEINARATRTADYIVERAEDLLRDHGVYRDDVLRGY